MELLGGGDGGDSHGEGSVGGLERVCGVMFVVVESQQMTRLFMGSVVHRDNKDDVIVSAFVSNTCSSSRAAAVSSVATRSALVSSRANIAHSRSIFHSSSFQPKNVGNAVPGLTISWASNPRAPDHGSAQPPAPFPSQICTPL